MPHVEQSRSETVDRALNDVGLLAGRQRRMHGSREVVSQTENQRPFQRFEQGAAYAVERTETSDSDNELDKFCDKNHTEVCREIDKDVAQDSGYGRGRIAAGVDAKHGDNRRSQSSRCKNTDNHAGNLTDLRQEAFHESAYDCVDQNQYDNKSYGA